VKEMAIFNADISDLVPEPVAAALADKLGRK
jgi:phosphopantetheine adenylyltransferase